MEDDKKDFCLAPPLLQLTRGLTACYKRCLKKNQQEQSVFCNDTERFHLKLKRVKQEESLGLVGTENVISSLQNTSEKSIVKKETVDFKDASSFFHGDLNNSSRNIIKCNNKIKNETNFLTNSYQSSFSENFNSRYLLSTSALFLKAPQHTKETNLEDCSFVGSKTGRSMKIVYYEYLIQYLQYKIVD
jgi:hypothetical protein